MKKCPACAEAVQDEARVCRFCGYRFGGRGSVPIAGTHDEGDRLGGTPADLDVTLAQARQAWLEVMSEHKTGPGIVDLPEAVSLRSTHVANARVTASREEILRLMPKGGVVAEVGVAGGRFSTKILEIVRPRRLHLFDTNLNHACAGFGREIEAATVELHEGFSWERLPDLLDRTLDFIYIDADHRYSGVRRDVEIAKQKVRPEGFLIFNDYTYWSPLECMKYGVVEAVNELCVTEGWEIVYFSLAPRMYCDVAIRRIGR